MAADDITAQAQAWAADEIARQCLGENYGWSVTWGPVAMPNGQGGAVMVPVWQLLLTCRNPLLGEGDLYHLAQIGFPRPKEADVRREVAEGLRQLRELASSKIAGGNGRAPVAGAPRGSGGAA